MGFISREYRLGNSARWVAWNGRPHLSPSDYMIFSEAILVFRLLHAFIVQVLDYFDIVPFQLPLNSYHLIVTFCIIFSKYCGVALLVVHFAFIYGLNALTKHAGIWYLTG